MSMAEFSEYRETVNRELESFVKASTNPHAKGWESKFDSLMMNYIMNSGKRMRPILGIMVYKGLGGKDVNSMIQMSRSFELLHNACLIHDDIMDSSPTRRGKPTFHKAMQHWMEENGQIARAEEDGKNIGILGGDYFIFMSIRSIMESNFPAEIKAEAANIVCKLAERTVKGQVLDMEFANRAIREKDYMRLIELKTAVFFEGTVRVAAVASGASKSIDRKLAKYAMNMGYAFQIKDDLIGLFGNEETIGKSNKSDIEEGKNTILMIKAREMGNSKVRETIDNILGKRHISNVELEKMKKAVTDSGSLSYARGLLDNYAKSSNKILEDIKGSMYKDSYTFLNSLVSFTVNRKF